MATIESEAFRLLAAECRIRIALAEYIDQFLDPPPVKDHVLVLNVLPGDREDPGWPGEFTVDITFSTRYCDEEGL